MSNKHHCEKWDKLIGLEPITLNDDGTIGIAWYAEFIEGDEALYKEIPFIYCPYCGAKLNE